MPDDSQAALPLEKPAETPAATPAPPAAAPVDDRIEKLTRTVEALSDTFQGLLNAQGRQTQPQGPVSTPAQIPPAWRQAMRQQGLDDATIDANAGIVLPMVNTVLAAVTPEVLGRIDGVKGDLDMERASRNTKAYPHWNDVADEVERLRAESQKQGMPLTVRGAYEAAVTNNFDKLMAKQAERRAESPAADLTTSGSIARQNLGSRAQSGPSAKSADDLMKMSREERQKYFEAHGDAVIH